MIFYIFLKDINKKKTFKKSFEKKIIFRLFYLDYKNCNPKYVELKAQHQFHI